MVSSLDSQYTLAVPTRHMKSCFYNSLHAADTSIQRQITFPHFSKFTLSLMKIKRSWLFREVVEIIKLAVPIVSSCIYYVTAALVNSQHESLSLSLSLSLVSDVLLSTTAVLSVSLTSWSFN